jgi:hypothetical protein
MRLPSMAHSPASRATLAFDPVNWSRPQVVRVGAATNPDGAEDLATISVSSTGLATVSIRVSVLELSTTLPPDLVLADGFE